MAKDTFCKQCLCLPLFSHTLGIIIGTKKEKKKIAHQHHSFQREEVSFSTLFPLKVWWNIGNFLHNFFKGPLMSFQLFLFWDKPTDSWILQHLSVGVSIIYAYLPAAIPLEWEWSFKMKYSMYYSWKEEFSILPFVIEVIQPLGFTWSPCRDTRVTPSHFIFCADSQDRSSNIDIKLCLGSWLRVPHDVNFWPSTFWPAVTATKIHNSVPLLSRGSAPHHWSSSGTPCFCHRLLE